MKDTCDNNTLHRDMLPTHDTPSDHSVKNITPGCNFHIEQIQQIQ